MRLNIKGSFDVKNPEPTPNLSLNIFSSKSFFSFFVQKMDTFKLSLICIMYKVTN